MGCINLLLDIIRAGCLIGLVEYQLPLIFLCLCTQVVFYKRLNRVFFIEAIPKSPSGKILRKDLRAKLATGFPN